MSRPIKDAKSIKKVFDLIYTHTLLIPLKLKTLHAQSAIVNKVH